MTTLTLARLKGLLHYDQETGVFTWKVTRSRSAGVGTVAGTTTSHGYVAIGIDGRLHKAHRLAWLYVHGVWPSDQIDHINRVRGDNRISNLRVADNSKNQANASLQKNNNSGVRGVYWNNASNKWHAQIYADGKKRHLGFFDNLGDASAAYCEAARAYHGEFARTA